jgi:hypothetical protein
VPAANDSPFGNRLTSLVDALLEKTHVLFRSIGFVHGLLHTERRHHALPAVIQMVLAGEVESLAEKEREEPTHVHVSPQGELIPRSLGMPVLLIHIPYCSPFSTIVVR